MRLKPLAGLVGMLLVSAPAYALTEVDTELQLLMDVSGSVSASEFNLQLQGYVDAFYSQAVQDAILDTSDGKAGHHRRADGDVERLDPAGGDDRLVLPL